jgi:two-component system, probable response regulator PhcQ
MLNKHIVLVVDDEADFLSSMRRLLRKEPYTLLTAESGKAALELLKRNEVSLVMSDYLMPGMDGLALLKEVRLRYPRIITIMLTALSEVEIAIKAVNEAGVYKFFLKPVEHNDLKLTLIRSLEFVDLTHERDDLYRKLITYDAILEQLERKHPGITHVERDQNGCCIIDESSKLF